MTIIPFFSTSRKRSPWHSATAGVLYLSILLFLLLSRFSRSSFRVVYFHGAAPVKYAGISVDPDERWFKARICRACSASISLSTSTKRNSQKKSADATEWIIDELADARPNNCLLWHTQTRCHWVKVNYCSNMRRKINIIDCLCKR